MGLCYKENKTTVVQQGIAKFEELLWPVSQNIYHIK